MGGGVGWEWNRWHADDQTMGMLWGSTQLPVGVVWVHTQERPWWSWLKMPHRPYSPVVALAQFQAFSIFRLGPFMFFMFHPSVNWANFAPGPKAVLQRLSPVLQLSISSPRMGSVTARMPPVQPSQKDWSGLSQGVKSGQQPQQGRSRTRGWTMQRTGSFSEQGVSPSCGSQLLQDMRPTQLFFSSGQMVALKVRPFLVGMLCWLSEKKMSTLRQKPSRQSKTSALADSIQLIMIQKIVAWLNSSQQCPCLTGASSIHLHSLNCSISHHYKTQPINYFSTGFTSRIQEGLSHHSSSVQPLLQRARISK